MTLDLRVRRIEDVIFGTADPTFSGDQFDYLAFGRRLQYQRVVPVAPMGPECPALLDVGEFTTLVRDAYAHTMATPGYIASGIFEFSDFGLFGSCALPIDLPTSTCLIGSALDWEWDFTAFYLGTSVAAGQCTALTLHDDQAGFSVKLAGDRIYDVHEPCLILGHPGQGIYGHWILDLLPRLHVLTQCNLQADLDIYIGYLPEWSHVFLEAFGFRPEKIRPPPPGLTRFHRAWMASSTKSGHRLGLPLMRDAWQHMKNFAKATANRPDLSRLADLPVAEKILISREDWRDPRRQIANIAEIHDLAVKNGYKILLPERYSPLEQAAIFHRARAIIGEDGSALHNIIFSEPGCILGVIGIPDRLNLWHLGICHALGHKATYMQADDGNVPGERRACLDTFREMLSVIDAHLTR